LVLVLVLSLFSKILITRLIKHHVYAAV